MQGAPQVFISVNFTDKPETVDLGYSSQPE